MAEQILHMQDPAQWQALCGNFDENIRTLEQLYEVTIVCRDTEIKVNGAEARQQRYCNPCCKCWKLVSPSPCKPSAMRQ